MSFARNASLYVALFLSGSAALIYQSTWGRMMHRVFGVSDLAIATVLATFFLGLGLGSALGARLGKRARPARLYAILEVIIGGWALLSLLLIPRIHDVYAAVGADASFGVLTFFRFAIAVLVLLPPTLLMGATLPVLIAAVARQRFSWSSAATKLYATNTFGAVVGAGITGLFLVPTFGAKVSIVFAAGASFAAALIVFATWSRAEAPEPSEAAAESGTENTSGRRLPRKVVLAMTLAGIAGLASLASEVLWTRVLRLVVQGTTQAFAAMLVNFLLGIGLGAIIADRLVANGKRSPVTLFGITQLMLVALSGAAMFVGSQVPRLLVLIQGSTDIIPHEAWVVLAVSTVLLFPLALVLGTSIPLAWKIAGGDAEEAADYSGRILATNTLGGLLGSLAAGFLLVPNLGINASVMVVAIVHCIAATIAFVSRAYNARLVPKVLAAVGPFALFVGMITVEPSLNVPYLLDAWYDGYSAVVSGPSDPQWDEEGHLLFLEEGRNTTVSVLNREGSLRLFNDGRPESGFGGADPGFGEELVTLGSLPSLVAEEHNRAMVIGLGAGHTTSVLLGGPWERVDVVELENSVVNAARFLHETREVDFPLDNERAHTIVDDARAQLVLAAEDTYDAIVSQPSHPWLAGSSALYTHEFFQEADRALTPGGVLVLWSNLFRMDIRHLKSIVATLLEVFPHVNAFIAETSSFILLAGQHPIVFDDALQERLQVEGLQPFLQPFAMDTPADFARFVELDTASARACSAGADLIIDDKPVLEFELARIPHFDGISEQQMDASLMSQPWVTAETLGSWGEALRADIIAERLLYAANRRGARSRVEATVRDEACRALLSEADIAYLEGLAAELAGNTSGAIESYRRALADERVVDRYTNLLAGEQLHRRLLDVPAAMALPLSAKPHLRAGLALNNNDSLRAALAIAERVNSAGDRPLQAFTRARLDHGCPGVLRAMNNYDTELRDEYRAMEIAARCAFAAGLSEDGVEFNNQALRQRRVEAAQLVTEAQQVNNQANEVRAMRLFGQALKHWPGNAPAAAAYATTADRLGHREAAERALRTAHHLTRGLPAASRVLSTASGDLDISLTGD